MAKILWFDTETTGLDPIKNDIIQIAYAIEIDGKIELQKKLNCQPWNYDNVSNLAMQVHGITVDEMKTFQPPQEVHAEILADFGKFVDKFNKADKFTPGGYNVMFDLQFLANFFSKAGDKYFGSWQNWYPIDPYGLITLMRGRGKGFMGLPNLKLETVAEYLGVPLKAHDALDDIMATIEITKRIEAKIFGNTDTYKCNACGPIHQCTMSCDYPERPNMPKFCPYDEPGPEETSAQPKWVKNDD